MQLLQLLIGGIAQGCIYGLIALGFVLIYKVQNPYLDDASQPIRFWATKYKTKFNEDPTVFSVYGYTIVDAFANAATKAGKGLTTDSFIKAMDTMTIPPNIFGSSNATCTATKRLGSDESRLSQIQDGKWKPVSEYLGPVNAAAKAGATVAAKK